MEVGGEVQPAVVAAGAEQRREHRVVAGQHHRRVDPRQQLIRAPVAELLDHAPLVAACGLVSDPAPGAGVGDHPLRETDRLLEAGEPG